MSSPEPTPGLVSAPQDGKTDALSGATEGRRASPGPLLLDQVDLVLAGLAALLVLPLALLPGDSAVGLARNALGLLFVLFLPGYVTTVIAFPGEERIDGIERFTLSFGLSVAISMLVGLGLTYTTWGLRLAPVLVSLAVVVMVGSVVALLRRQAHGPSPGLTPDSRVYTLLASAPDAVRSRGWRTFPLALAFVLAIGLVVAAQPSLHAPVTMPGQQLTEFYLVGADGKLGDADHVAVYGQTDSVSLGLRNLAGAPADYRIVATIDGLPVGEIQRIRLDTGERWEGNLAYQPPSAMPRQLVTFQLYQGTSASPSEYLQLWIDVAGTG